MYFQSLHFKPISILVPTFSFHHFQSLNQLTRVILVLSVSQQTEIAEVANRLIKILIKIQRGSRHPCHMGFPPLYVTRDPHYPVNLPNQYQKPKINTRNPKLPKFELGPPPTQLILISPNHDQNKQSSKPNGSKLFTSSSVRRRAPMTCYCN